MAFFFFSSPRPGSARDKNYGRKEESVCTASFLVCEQVLRVLHLLRTYLQAFFFLPLTFLPTSLLCKLKAVRASFPFSSLSIKRFVSFSPYLKLSLHPPHCQSSFSFRCFLTLAHEHPGMLPCRHWCVISCVMAAALIAWMKAVSRVATTKQHRRKLESETWLDVMKISSCNFYWSFTINARLFVGVYDSSWNTIMLTRWSYYWCSLVSV